MPALLPPFGRSKQSGGSAHGRPGSLSRSGSSASASVKDKDVKFRSAAPACELFKMLTAMAAGKHASDSDDADLSADPAAAIVVDDVSAGPAAETEGSDAEPRISESTARSSTETAVDQWMDDTLHQTPRQRDILSARFTALSLSNLSPYGEPMLGDDEQPKSRPPLPTFTSKLTSDPEQETPSGTPASSAPGSPTFPAADAPPPVATPLVMPQPVRNGSMRSNDPSYVEPTDDEKLAAITEEFGDISALFEGGEPERMLAESKGSLFKSVMMIGNLHLTTHRLLFHALLPPDSAFERTRGDPSADHDAALRAVAQQSEVLYAGPITVHRTSPLKHSKRVWLELTTELITSYPRGDEAGRVRPLQSILMSSVRHLEPLDPTKPRDFYVVYDAIDGPRRTHFTVDTEQSAVQWRRAMQSALFRHLRMQWRHAQEKQTSEDRARHPFPVAAPPDSWSTIRCCLPLDRVSIRGVCDYHGFSTLVGLDANLGRGRRSRPDISDKLPEGDFGADCIPLPTRATSAAAATATGPTRTGSLRSALPLSFMKRSASGSREASPSRAGPAPVRSDTQSSMSRMFDSFSAQMPAVKTDSLYDARSRPPHSPTPSQRNSSGNHLSEEDEHIMTFNVAVLNEQAWFVQALEAAVQAAAERKHQPGAAPTRCSLDIAGFDCLATDEELDAEAQSSSATTPMTSDAEPDADDHDEDHDDDPAERRTGHAAHGKQWARETSKAAKVSMAAKVFGLREEDGVYIKRGYVATGVVPARGHIIVTPKYICFWRRAVVGADIKYRFKTEDVKGVEVAPGIRATFHGMALKIHGQHDVRFEFWKEASREEVIRKIRDVLHVNAASSAASRSQTNAGGVSSAASADSSSSAPTVGGSSADTPCNDLGSPDSARLPPPLSPGDLESMLNAPVYDKAGAGAHAADILAPTREALFARAAVSDQVHNYMPFIANRPILAPAQLTPRTFVCLTIGSRGDVQPYIALCLRLKADGHKTVIVTHDEFKTWIEGYGIEHRQAGGDPTALMKLSTDHKMFSPGFFKESLGSFRQWLDDLLLDSWLACKDADVLIESPSTMSGVHIAEALQIPYFRAFTMPWTRTSAYPHAFMVPAFEMGPSFNYSTYVLFDNIMWQATSGQINRWRKKYLGLRSTDMSTLSITKIPFLYNFSPAVVPKPLDWHDDIFITGYWNLANSDMEWTPPDALQAFMDQATADQRPLVYIGFGSIVVPDPSGMTRSIVKAVEKSGVRAIIAKGWSSRGGDKEAQEVPLPDSCFGVDKIPHGWLFPKIQAALHHGGAGTVGASLRAGLPTLIKPWFGDQFFWANRVTKLEVGLRVASLRSDDIAAALIKATSNRVMIEKAARIGELIRSEDGVENAVQAIRQNILRAGSNRKTL